MDQKYLVVSGHDIDAAEDASFTRIMTLLTSFYYTFVERPLKDKLFLKYTGILTDINDDELLSAFWNAQYDEFRLRAELNERGIRNLPGDVSNASTAKRSPDGSESKSGSGTKILPNRSNSDVEYHELFKSARFRTRSGIRQLLQWKTKLRENYLQSGRFRNPFISYVAQSYMDPELCGYFIRRFRPLEDAETSKGDIESFERFSRRSPRYNEQLRILFKNGSIAASKAILTNGRTGINSDWHFDICDFETALEGAIKNTSAGSPTFLKKNDVKAQAAALLRWKDFISDPLYIKLNDDFCAGRPLDESKLDILVANFCSDFQIIFHRVQVSIKNDDFAGLKLRQVWCVPFFIVVVERMFFSNMLNYILENGDNAEFPVYGSGVNPGKISGVIGNIRNISANLGVKGEFNFYQSDFKKFDSTVPSLFHDLFFESMLDYINIPRELQLLYDVLRRYEKFSPYVYKGSLLVKTRGISSGSFLTSLFGSWVNLTLTIVSKRIYNSLPNEKAMYYSKVDSVPSASITSIVDVRGLNSLAHVDSPTDGSLIVCGDDLLWVSNSAQNNVMTHLCAELGMNVLFSNAYYGYEDNIYFLGRFWDTLNRPYQPIMWYVAHILARTKVYDFEYEGFENLDHFEVDRVLSICRPYSNGLSILDLLFRGKERKWPRLEAALRNPDYSFKDVRDFGGRDDTGKFKLKRVSDIGQWRED